MGGGISGKAEPYGSYAQLYSSGWTQQPAHTIDKRKAATERLRDIAPSFVMFFVYSNDSTTF
jgi:hypothetical protein